MVVSKTASMQHGNVAQKFAVYPNTTGFPPTDSFQQGGYAEQEWVPSNIAIQDSSMAVQETNVTVCRSSMAAQGWDIPAQNMAAHIAQGLNVTVQDLNVSVQGSNMGVQDSFELFVSSPLQSSHHLIQHQHSARKTAETANICKSYKFPSIEFASDQEFDLQGYRKLNLMVPLDAP